MYVLQEMKIFRRNTNNTTLANPFLTLSQSIHSRHSGLVKTLINNTVTTTNILFILRIKVYIHFPLPQLAGLFQAGVEEEKYKGKYNASNVLKQVNSR